MLKNEEEQDRIGLNVAILFANMQLNSSPDSLRRDVSHSRIAQEMLHQERVGPDVLKFQELQHGFQHGSFPWQDVGVHTELLDAQGF